MEYNQTGETFLMKVRVPGNTEAEVILPAKKDINKVNVNGQLVKTILKDGKVFLPVLRSGVYHIVLN